MGLIIKKRFGPRNFVQYLHLKAVYSVGTKAKKEQQVYVKGGTGYIYKQTPDEKAAYDSQQAINTTRQGSLNPHYGDPTDNLQSFQMVSQTSSSCKSEF